MIRVRGITQHYGVKPVLKDISLDIPEGTRTAVVGPNGMGKTTFLSVLGGVIQPQHGTIEIGGLVRRSSVESEIAIRQMSVFLPDRAFLPKNRTGREFLMGVGRLYRIDEDRLLDHSQRLMNLFELDHLADTPIRNYSAGQQKKIALSSALITEASTLLLDEPFSGGLDPAGILALKHLLRRLSLEQGKTVVLTSPVPELVAEVADRLIVISAGEVTFDGSLEDLKQQSGLDGSIDQVLHEMVFPETMHKVEAYFAGEQS